MHVVVINQFYWPSVAATAALVTDVCEALAERGHRVTVVCSQGDYLGGRRRRVWREHRQGVEILRLPATSFGKGHPLRRVTDYGSFFALTAIAVPLLPAADVYVSLTTPPLVAAVGTLTARLRGGRSVLWCHDVYPELATALGALGESGLLARALKRLSRLALTASDQVVAVGETMASELVTLGADTPAVVHNWCDGQSIHPARASMPAQSGFRREIGASPQDVVVLHAGNLGRAHDFEGLRWVFDQLGRGPATRSLCLAFVGDGVRKSTLRAWSRPAIERGARVVFLPYQPTSRLADVLTGADIHLVCVDDRAAGLMVPSKIYSALAAGRAIVYAGPGGCEAAEIVTGAKCGVHVRAGDGPELLDALVALAADPARRHRLGARGRALFDDRFDARKGCGRFVDLIVEDFAIQAHVKSPCGPKWSMATKDLPLATPNLITADEAGLQPRVRGGRADEPGVGPGACRSTPPRRGARRSRPLSASESLGICPTCLRHPSSTLATRGAGHSVRNCPTGS